MRQTTDWTSISDTIAETLEECHRDNIEDVKHCAMRVRYRLQQAGFNFSVGQPDRKAVTTTRRTVTQARKTRKTRKTKPTIIKHGTTGLARRLSEARQNRGLSVAEVADKIGVSSSSIYFWETGYCRPRDRNLSALCRLLKLPIRATRGMASGRPTLRLIRQS